MKIDMNYVIKTTISVLLLLISIPYGLLYFITILNDPWGIAPTIMPVNITYHALTMFILVLFINITWFMSTLKETSVRINEVFLKLACGIGITEIGYITAAEYNGGRYPLLSLDWWFNISEPYDLLPIITVGSIVILILIKRKYNDPYKNKKLFYCMFLISIFLILFGRGYLNLDWSPEGIPNNMPIIWGLTKIFGYLGWLCI